MTLNWAKDYQPIVYQAFKAGMAMVDQSVIPTLFDVQGSTDANEYHIGVGGSSTETWDEYENLGISGFMDQERGYATTFTHLEKTAKFKLLKKHIEDRGAFRVAQESIENAGINLQLKREKDAADIFNNSFSASFTGADGVALCSNSHPQAPDNTGATYDNLATAAFSHTALKAGRVQLRGLENSFGDRLRRNGRLILHPIELTDAIDEVINAQAKPGTADNDANSTGTRRGYSALEWDELTDAANWWLIDPLWVKRHLKWYNRVLLEIMIVEEATTHVVYEFRSRYSLGWTDPRWLIGFDA
jgi:hypothetical protein